MKSTCFCAAAECLSHDGVARCPDLGRASAPAQPESPAGMKARRHAEYPSVTEAARGGGVQCLSDAGSRFTVSAGASHLHVAPSQLFATEARLPAANEGG